MSTPTDDITYSEQLQYDSIKEFLQVHNRDVAKLREADFVQGVLAYLVHPDPSKRSLTQWIKHAGHVTNEIDVVSNTGEVLFRCPAPLFHPHTRSPEERKNSAPIDAVINNAILHEQRMPGLGSKMMVEEISSTIKPQSELESFHARWNAVLARYDLPPIGGTEAAVAAEQESAKQIAAEESAPRYSEDDEEI